MLCFGILLAAVLTSAVSDLLLYVDAESPVVTCPNDVVDAATGVGVMTYAHSFVASADDNVGVTVGPSCNASSPYDFPGDVPL